MLGKTKTPKPTAVDKTLLGLKAALDQIGVEGASQVQYTAKGAGGSVSKFTISPATPVDPVGMPTVADVSASPPSGFFDFRNPDGSWNTTKIAIFGVGGIAVVAGIAALMRRRRR